MPGELEQRRGEREALKVIRPRTDAAAIRGWASVPILRGRYARTSGAGIVSWTTDDVLTLQSMERTGITFSVKDGKIMARPANAVNPAQFSWIVERKAALLELIAARESWEAIAPHYAAWSQWTAARRGG